MGRVIFMLSPVSVAPAAGVWFLIQLFPFVGFSHAPAAFFAFSSYLVQDQFLGDA